MNYAIIEIQGKQYRVKPGDTLKIPGTYGQKDETISLGRVLLLQDGEVKIGTPALEDKIQLKVVDFQKTEKVRVATYRAKSRHRKVRGHRQDLTVFEVVALGSLKAEAKKAEAKKAEPKKAASAEKKPAAKKSAAKQETKPAAKKATAAK